jgi:hypothetical protein
MKRKRNGIVLLRKKPVYPKYGSVEPKKSRIISTEGWWWIQFPGQKRFGLSVYKGFVRWSEQRRYVGKEWRALAKRFRQNDATMKHDPRLDPPF